MTKQTLGIRRETKSAFERRSPLTPQAVWRLVHEHGVEVFLERSPIRVYSDEEMEAAGAVLVDDAFDADLVVAVKEIPPELFRPDGRYLYFSHTIKGQAKNMPALQRLVDLGCTLFDYERIVDEDGKRLIFFSWFAGAAGLVDTLWTLGRRQAAQGRPTLWSKVKRAWEYGSLAQVDEAMDELSEIIERDGLPAPLTVGIAGYGNVSRGAQHVLDRLPVEAVTPDRLIDPAAPQPLDRIQKVVFHEEHMVEPLEGEFDLDTYHHHPDRYRAIFPRYADRLDVLVNAIFWTADCPRLVTLDMLRGWSERPEPPRLQVVGDISADLRGAIECTVRFTDPSAPSYVYDARTGAVSDDLGAPGLAVMAVDFLPCELPLNASEAFSRALMPFLPDLLEADLTADLDHIKLPDPLRAALILYRGQFTPEYRYMSAFLTPKDTLEP